jgi:hypothetical protein
MVAVPANLQFAPDTVTQPDLFVPSGQPHCDRGISEGSTAPRSGLRVFLVHPHPNKFLARERAVARVVPAHVRDVALVVGRADDAAGNLGHGVELFANAGVGFHTGADRRMERMAGLWPGGR